MIYFSSPVAFRFGIVSNLLRLSSDSHLKDSPWGFFSLAHVAAIHRSYVHSTFQPFPSGSKLFSVQYLPPEQSKSVHVMVRFAGYHYMIDIFHYWPWTHRTSSTSKLVVRNRRKPSFIVHNWLFKYENPSHSNLHLPDLYFRLHQRKTLE